MSRESVTVSVLTNHDVLVLEPELRINTSVQGKEVIGRDAL
jgi:hypothetical protein